MSGAAIRGGFLCVSVMHCDQRDESGTDEPLGEAFPEGLGAGDVRLVAIRAVRINLRVP